MRTGPYLFLPEKPSIAVLPFTNMSGDPEQGYFADGMAEDITTALSKVWWFSVAARNSAFAYKGKAVDVREVGRELGARYVLEGSVRKAGNQVRITAQLLDSTTGHHVWAERYDRELADTFAVQDEITEQVVAAIGPQLYTAEGLRAKRKAPESFDAWECVVRALALLNSRARADIQAARVLLNKAVLIDPGYAKAHSLLSFAITLGVHMGWDKSEDVLGVASAHCASGPATRRRRSLGASGIGLRPCLEQATCRGGSRSTKGRSRSTQLRHCALASWTRAELPRTCRQSVRACREGG